MKKENKRGASFFLFAGNCLACAILLRPSMRNSFNLLLVTLAIVDSLYMAFGIVEAVSDARARYYIRLLTSHF